MSLISILFLNKGGGGSHKILNCRVYGILSMELVVWLNLWLIGVGNFVIGSKWKKLKRIIEFETLKWSFMVENFRGIENLAIVLIMIF